MKTLVCGGDVVFYDCVKKSDILIQDGKIIKIAEKLFPTVIGK